MLCCRVHSSPPQLNQIPQRRRKILVFFSLSVFLLASVERFGVSRMRDFSFANVYFFYIHGDNESGIFNVIETNKHLNTMKNHCVVQIRLHILAICLLRTTALFINDHSVFFVVKRSHWTTK